jgi:pimeloyl-ACP methyl ester carboxylesterase
MLPGGFGTAYTSWQYISALAPHQRVIALHYPPDLATMAELCTDLIVLFDQLGVAQVDLLGGSASGLVAQMLVRRAPARIRMLMLAQTGAPQPQRVHWARLCAAVCAHLPLPLLYGLLRLAIYGFLPESTPSRVFWRAHFAEVLAAQSRLALVNRFRLAADFDATAQFTPTDLADWSGRIILLESANDGMISAAERQQLRTLYPTATVITLAGAHNASVEHPDAQIAALHYCRSAV